VKESALRRLLTRLADIGVVILPLLVFAGLVAAYLGLVGLREIIPPNQLTMAAGRAGGGYDAYAQQYREILARDGIRLRILETAGSVENARLLEDGTADVALLQGGIPVAPSAGIEALAAITLEPFFIFYRSDLDDAADPTGWEGLRVAAGEPGGGTRAAIETVVEVLELDIDPGGFLPFGGADAAQALMRGEADVAVFVAPIDAPYLAPLLPRDKIAISSLRDAESLSRRVPFIHPADIPRAGLDYVARIPRERVPLLAMIATLAGQGDLHPALVNRLVRAAQEIHDGPILISDTLTFPSAQGASLPMKPQAAQTLAGAPGLLERLLPYWIAAQITRVTVLLVPLLVLLVPLFRALPGIYAWRMRARVYRRYRRLVAIDAEADAPMSEARRRRLLDELDAIDQEAKALDVPPRYREYAYTLRLHIDLVRRRLAGVEPA